MRKRDICNWPLIRVIPLHTLTTIIAHVYNNRRADISLIDSPCRERVSLRAGDALALDRMRQHLIERPEVYRVFPAMRLLPSEALLIPCSWRGYMRLKVYIPISPAIFDPRVPAKYKKEAGAILTMPEVSAKLNEDHTVFVQVANEKYGRPDTVACDGHVWVRSSEWRSR